MFDVTDKALEAMTTFFAERDNPPCVRVYLNSGGCGGPSLAMALDEKHDSDHLFEKNGITFVMNKELLEDAKPITVDYIENDYGAGYAISSSLPRSGGCSGSCSSC